MLMIPGHAIAQGVVDRVARVGTGTVRLSFAAKPGVCGDGHNVRTTRRTDDWESWCEDGPVRIVLHLRDGQVFNIDTYVGGRWRPAPDVTDLGTVSAPEAAEYLLSLVATAASGAGKEAIVPAVLADSATVWPRLLEIARDENLPRGIRRNAVFWLGQSAGEEATRGLEEIVDDADADLKVREHAVFALSQLPDDEAIPTLIRLARSHPSARIRRKALFWLGESGDPRAVALFEEILLQR